MTRLVIKFPALLTLELNRNYEFGTTPRDCENSEKYMQYSHSVMSRSFSLIFCINLLEQQVAAMLPLLVLCVCSKDYSQIGAHVF